jgi:hypothetical protein
MLFSVKHADEDLGIMVAASVTKRAFEGGPRGTRALMWTTARAIVLLIAVSVIAWPWHREASATEAAQGDTSMTKRPDEQSPLDKPAERLKEFLDARRPKTDTPEPEAGLDEDGVRGKDQPELSPQEQGMDRAAEQLRKREESRRLHQPESSKPEDDSR